MLIVLFKFSPHPLIDKQNICYVICYYFIIYLNDYILYYAITSTNKTYHHNLTEILLKVALSIITLLHFVLFL
jgi:hypothetical protein